MENPHRESDLERQGPSTMAAKNSQRKDGRKKVLIVGAGAAGMSAAHHLADFPEKFDVTLIDSNNYCGGQAFSIPLDKERHGASWFNQGVQGGSHIFHHTVTMFKQQGFHADPVTLQVSFGKDETFWTNVFPTELLAKHQKEIARMTTLLKIMRMFEIFFALLPLRLVFKLFMFSEDFINTVALPMTALFLGTGNYTPSTPAMMFERLCTSPTYGMWYPADPNTVVKHNPPMIVFPNFSEFYAAWHKDLTSRGINVRLSTGLIEITSRSKNKGVDVLTRKRRPVEDGHNPDFEDTDIPTQSEHYDELILCTLADRAKQLLGRTSTWRERKVLGSAKFSDDITITHTDSAYMKKHYDNFYRTDQAVSSLSGKDQTSRNEWAQKYFRPMYYIKEYPQDRSKLEMCFDTTNYQSQFPPNVPFEDHVFQTIFLNKKRDGHLWSDSEIDKSKIIRADWWHQLCHSFTHYLFVVPWIMFMQNRLSTHFAGSWTLVNAHEVAVMSGIAAAVNLGGEYPEDLENDKFAFLCFRLYYLLTYGKWYRRRYEHSQSQKAKDGRSWANGLYGSEYKGPGVTGEEKVTWKEEMKLGRSTGNLAEGNKEGRSQP